MVSESLVYVKVKRFLIDHGWRAVAGDPPRGTDLPPLEVKEPNMTHSLRKNANSVIFDLVFENGEYMLLIECKDSKSKIGSDIKKLRKVIRSATWRESLLNSLQSGPFLNGSKLGEDAILDGDALIPCVAHPDQLRYDIPNFIQFRVGENEVDVRIGSEVPIMQL